MLPSWYIHARNSPPEDDVWNGVGETIARRSEQEDPGSMKTVHIFQSLPRLGHFLYRQAIISSFYFKK